MSQFGGILSVCHKEPDKTTTMRLESLCRTFHEVTA